MGLDLVIWVRSALETNCRNRAVYHITQPQVMYDCSYCLAPGTSLCHQVPPILDGGPSVLLHFNYFTLSCMCSSCSGFPSFLVLRVCIMVPCYTYERNCLEAPFLLLHAVTFPSALQVQLFCCFFGEVCASTECVLCEVVLKLSTC